MGKIVEKRSNFKYTQKRAQPPSRGKKSRPSTNSKPSESSARRISSSSSESDTSESEVSNVPSTSLSSISQNRAGQSQVEISASEESRLVSDCVFYLLVADQKKFPIKKPDIVKNVFKEHRKQYKDVMKNVELLLKEVFGMRLVELETHKGQYILVNDVKNSAEFSDVSAAEKRKLGFTMVVLAIIFMKEDYVPENDMWKALKNIGIDPDSKHPVFGDVKKLLTQELVKQMYIEYKKENSDPPVFVFSWGSRSKFEVSKKTVLQFVCDIFGDMTPDQWPNQYNDAMASEKGNEES